jgi:uncharacterized protein (DUF983 family)
MGGGFGFEASGFPAVLALLLLAAVIVYPFWRILPRAGIPPWVAIFAVFPLVTLALLWVLALKRWPGDAPREV